MRLETRPLGHWTDPETAVREGSGRFRADWNATLKLPGGLRPRELPSAGQAALERAERDD
jgi:hypothetical protein